MRKEDDAVDIPLPKGGALPTFCRGNWKQLVILLGVSATLVLGVAIRSYMAGDQGTVDVTGWMSDRFDPRKPTIGPGAKPIALVGQAGGSNVRPVAANLRTPFNEAATRIQPSTLAVRASYAADGTGQLLERSGSAVVVDLAGYAITCTHVVMGASTIAVRRFQEPERWTAARAIASDGDLTLLQVTDGAPMTAAAFADSAAVNVGDWVLAVGHPFQLGTTVTAGIVSRRDVSLALPGGRAQTGLFQTDAAINEGSSGGPLVNPAGEVIGINSAIYAPTGAFSGAGFAIPSNQVRAFVSSVLGAKAASAPSGWGLGLVTLTPELAVELSYSGASGVVVSNVAPDSAAARAQLLKGDVITKIAGQAASDLPSAVAIRGRLAPNEPVTIEFFRGGAVSSVVLRPEAG
jgi:serine protease Do